MNNKISTPEFQESAINWLGGAVRVPTESFDNMDPVGVDPRWNAFGPFHDYLLSAFPLVHSKLKLNKVNTYGLYYEWTGSDASLKPLLLAAHQDVVPVDPTTVDQWTHPPYSGYFDGKRIWGRGSSDDKSGLIGILTSIETLLAANFEPTRTVVLAFGFDEEASGFQGAGKLGPFLQEIYGEDGFAMVVDEGSGFVEQYGTVVATPGIAEKGFLNTLVEVTAPGGHSSIPPAHTSIGILSSLLVHFERNPYKVEITRHEPMYDTLQCVAEHGKSVPAKLRKVIKKSAHSKSALRALQEFIREDKVLSSLVGTTQAIDLIHGGVKSNALPEQAWAIVNHRIAVVSSVDAVKAHDTALLESLSKKFNLTYSAFGKKISQDGASASGTLTLSDAFNGALEPAPITPTDKDAAPYHLLSGTIKATFNAHRGVDMDDSKSIIVAPSMMSGNTDTRFYWKLSKHIFRYNHHSAGNDSKNPLSSVHTVNEFAEVDSFLEMIRFFTTLILNADESTSL
ncbi:carboxypeptidase S [Agrocybe pediades]|nr:carboxypeptidase S [Agrocybe pediades]